MKNSQQNHRHDGPERNHCLGCLCLRYNSMAKTVSSGNVTVMDVLWGMGFVLIAWTRFLLSDAINIAAIACLVCITLWGLRLGFVLHKRTKNRGEDPRYVRMRETAGRHWWWISFLQVFVLQGVLLLIIALPIFRLSPGSAEPVDWPAEKIILSMMCLLGFLLGLLLEHKADMELKRFRELHGPGKLKTDGMFSAAPPNHLGRGDSLVVHRWICGRRWRQQCIARPHWASDSALLFAT